MIRTLTANDIPRAIEIVDSTGLFPGEMLGDMTAAFLAGSSDQNWLVHETDGQVDGLAFYAPEDMTEGTYNLYLIAVDKERQGKGIGGKLMAAAETELREAGHRILLVETSGLPEFELTREFYRKLDYVEAARIPEFYAAGEDKIVFWKKL